MRFSGGLRVEAWAARHALGEVPDHWPYGLHRLSDHGFDLRAAAPATAGHTARALRALGGYEWAVSGAGRLDDAALEICWDERSGVPAAWRSRQRGEPSVATGVIWLTDRARAAAAHRRLAGPALRRARLVWALSRAQLPVLRDQFGVRDSRLAHVTFGIDADFFAAGPQAATPGLVVAAGNDRHRDHALAVRAMAEVRRRVPAARLELATRQEVSLPDELGARHPVLDHRGMRALYQRAAVALVALRPNLHVSGVTVALEAMACGRPVVITDTPGMRDYVEHGVTGLLVPPGDVEALADAVAGLLLDPDRSAQLGRAGRRSVEERYTTVTQARQLAELLLAAE
jgi:glycosyltransferase involved in cell wall biosynthesis